MDKLNKEQRHRCMSAIKGKDTKPELLVRKFLFSRGFRYRLNHPRLPGHPDIVLRRYRTVIFVNGCFWHGHQGCKYFVLPKTNVEFWNEKIERNRSRDVEEQPSIGIYGLALHYHLGMSAKAESPSADFGVIGIYTFSYILGR